MHRDELLFQTVHQSSELWLKHAWSEVEESTRLVEAREVVLWVVVAVARAQSDEPGAGGPRMRWPELACGVHDRSHAMIETPYERLLAA